MSSNPATAHAELQARKAALLKSHWVAADPKAKQEFNPVSSTPLDLSYQRSRSMTRDMLYERNMMMSKHVVDGRLTVSPASAFVASKYQEGLPRTAHEDAKALMSRATMNIVLGSDPPYEPELGCTMTSNSKYGSTTGHRHPPGINLLEMVEPRRDTTCDGAHRCSLTEQHLSNIHNPWKSDFPERARSSTSGVLLRDLMHRHTRSGYNPDERYFQPPTEQYTVGWGILDKYGGSCAKYCPGAAWHGRKASHITRFQERLALGARHHLSGPMTKTELHY